jgi:succinyl-CoA synthetase beta subunit
MNTGRQGLVPTSASDAGQRIAAAVERGHIALSEYDSKRVLAAYDVPVVEERLVQTPAEAVRAAEELGYPVVVKASSPSLAHKSDQGLVMLNLHDADMVESAVAAIGKAAATPLDGCLVQRMLRGKREVIVGATRDTLFGPCVMLGIGGILVEALADVSFRLAPLAGRDALEMVNEIRSRRVFDAVRGEPAVDRITLSNVLIAVGQILIDHPQVSQVDVNPLIVEGGRPVAVDGLVALGPAENR